MTLTVAEIHANRLACIPCSRAAGTLGVCPSDHKPIHLHADAGYCPRALFTVNGEKPEGWDTIDDATPTPEVKAQDPAEWGPKLWREFHAAPRSGFLAFLTAFIARVPCGGCRDDFTALVADYPPPLDSDDSLFVWTWMIHNAVNRKLGKPEMALDEARKIWHRLT